MLALSVPLIIIVLIFVVIYASKRVWWITSVIILLGIGWVLIPLSSTSGNVVIGKAVFSLFILGLLLSARFFSRAYRQIGQDILNRYRKQK